MTAVQFVAADSGGCGWYRCYLPASALLDAGVAATVTHAIRVSYVDLLPRRMRAITTVHQLAPVNVFQRPLRDTMRELVEVAARQGARIIVELDDDFWSLPAHNPATLFLPPTGVANLARCCALAEAVIVSTDTLARRVRKETGQRNVVVIPNAIDPALFIPCDLPPDGATRIGWAGSTSHRADFAPIIPALARLAHECPAVDLYLFGDDVLDGTTIPHDFFGWSDNTIEHYRRIGVLDIALAPLVADRFNLSKSGVKFLEHAAHGTAMVLSRVRPYREVATDGATALFADTPRDWYRQLRRLIDDPILRRDIGQAARATVLADHTTDKRVKLYREVLCL